MKVVARNGTTHPTLLVMDKKDILRRSDACRFENCNFEVRFQNLHDYWSPSLFLGLGWDLTKTLTYANTWECESLHRDAHGRSFEIKCMSEGGICADNSSPETMHTLDVASIAHWVIPPRQGVVQVTASWAGYGGPLPMQRTIGTVDLS